MFATLGASRSCQHTRAQVQKEKKCGTFRVRDDKGDSPDAMNMRQLPVSEAHNQIQMLLVPIFWSARPVHHTRRARRHHEVVESQH